MLALMIAVVKLAQCHSHLLELPGKYIVEEVKHPQTGKPFIPARTLIDSKIVELLEKEIEQLQAKANADRSGELINQAQDVAFHA